ncbi:hypothetical protein SPNHU15_00534 [Streptococcus pneumoniae]|uniref:Uncharacterized protein n=1 Tax=Streptococcus pneumoniae serotype 4 (strain ATCC BAA-334 / TIGR4) TaxID=170187 RepID=A0A0H2UNM8_STRPN|nr:hypothetical protein SP_0465 [Streptococcus pneumoniae TIGR4]ARD34140.1 hypothetical protein SPNHU17_00528 [Streptococcus pneumoniae]EDK69476.1 hypothetical protein CGSSp18BS74_08425 [Streptococcus pneumoniae SP18-BS74]EHD52862.1 hypothetical protein SPAR40_0504 [Streptococcus pneumoniae GA16531]EHE02989.1 hypothetical protein SPAR39_0479 [Streptococcus pneumoniae GA16242]
MFLPFLSASLYLQTHHFIAFPNRQSYLLRETRKSHFFLIHHPF